MLDLFTVIWGSMVESFAEVTIPSLLQPENIPEAKKMLGAYTIYTDRETKDALTRRNIIKRLCKEINVLWEPLHGGKLNVTANILHQMKQSKSEGNFMMVISPDWAVGNGSLANMAELCLKDIYNPILYGFPRITEAGYDELKGRLKGGKTVSNRELVSLAMRNIEQKTYMIGISINSWILSNDTWIVAHNVPTPCLKPDDDLIEIFSTNNTLNSGYDHVMPYIMVEKGYPWHMIGSSDTYFQVERGRHIIGEQVFDASRWQLDKALMGLRFFNEQRQQWQA